ELVVGDLADIGGLAAKRGDPRDRVGGGAARLLDAHSHPAVERLGLVLIDQGHGALGELLGLDEGVFRLGKNVDNGVADADDIDSGGGHRIFRLWGSLRRSEYRARRLKGK